MSKKKIELIDRAYQKIEVSGVNFNPQPEDVVIEMDELEGMMAEWDSRNICCGYAFEDEPDPNTPSNVPRAFENAVKTNLAVRLTPEFGKDPSQILMMQASQSLSNLSGRSAKFKPIAPPTRQPIGSGNQYNTTKWSRYYRVDKGAPSDCNTKIMAKGDISDCNVNWIEWLGDEVIASYVIKPSNGLFLQSQSNTETEVSFVVEARMGGTQIVDITVTTDVGTVDKRRFYFSVVESKDA